MRQVIYAMQFKGRGGPIGESKTVLKASTSCHSCSIISVVDRRGIQGSVQPARGGVARFESEVTLTGQSSFRESGTITFGTGGNRLRFSTVGQGYLGSSPDPKVSHGAVTWRVDGGEGQFEGATGLITSNFTFSERGQIVDNQFGVIYVK